MPQTRPKQLQNQNVSALKVGSSLSALIVHTVDENGAFVSPGAGSTAVSIKGIFSADASTSLLDSTNNSLGVTIRAGSAAGTEYTDGDIDASISGQAILFDNSSNTLRPVTLTRGFPVNVVAGSAASTEQTIRQSTYTDLQGLVGLRDRDQATQTAAVLGAAPASTTYGLVTRDLSTGPYQVSSVGGAVIVRSSAADMAVTASQNSTAWSVLSRVTTSSGGAVEGSTTAPAPGAIGLHVRQVFPTLLSTTQLITSTHSTAVYEVIASGAGLRHKVYAYSVGSTHTNPSTLIFFSSAAGGDHWHVPFGSGSSGITGANLALTPPGFIFGSIVANALNVRIEGGSSVTATCVARISIGYFSEA